MGIIYFYYHAHLIYFFFYFSGDTKAQHKEIPQTDYDGVHSRFWPPKSEALTDVETPLNPGWVNTQTVQHPMGPKVTASPGDPEKGREEKNSCFVAWKYAINHANPGWVGAWVWCTGVLGLHPARLNMECNSFMLQRHITPLFNIQAAFAKK